MCVVTSNSTIAFFMLSTSKIILIRSWIGLASFDFVPAPTVSFLTASSSWKVKIVSELAKSQRIKVTGWLPWQQLKTNLMCAYYD